MFSREWWAWMHPRTEIFNISDLSKSKARCSWAAETVRGSLYVVYGTSKYCLLVLRCFMGISVISNFVNFVEFTTHNSLKNPWLRMPQMRPETKKRIQTLFKYSKTAFHWGFIPLIIYLGRVKDSTCSFGRRYPCTCDNFLTLHKELFNLLLLCRIKTRWWTWNAWAKFIEVSRGKKKVNGRKEVGKKNMRGIILSENVNKIWFSPCHISNRTEGRNW